MAAHATRLLEHDDRAELMRWGAAALVVLTAHLGLATAHLLFRSAAPQGATEVPAVIIDLAPLPVAPASPMDTTPGPESIESRARAEPTVTETQLEAVDLPPSEKPVVALRAEPPKPEVKREPQLVQPAEAKPEPLPQQRESNLQSAPPKTERTAPRPAAPQMGARGTNVSPSWVSLLMAHLNRHKQYPSAARARREQGVVMVSFTMDRNGHVLSKRIAKSSGSPALDQEGLAMLQRAQPLPRFPAEMAGDSRSFNAPIRFSLQ